MTHSLRLFALALVLMLSAPAWAITLINHGAIDCADGATTCATGNFTEGVGDLVLFSCNGTSGTSANTLGDTLSNSYSSAASTKDTVLGSNYYNVWYSENSKGGTNNVTCTAGSGSTSLHIIWTEWSGIGTAGSLDGAVTPTISDSSGSCTDAQTTTNANDLIVTVAMGNQWGGNYQSASVSSGFTIIDNDAPTHQHIIDSDRIVSATGTYSNTTTYTGGGGMNWFCATVAFKSSATASPAPRRIYSD